MRRRPPMDERREASARSRAAPWRVTNRGGARAVGGVALVLGLVVGARVARAGSVLEAGDNGSEPMGRAGAWIARASDPLATAYNPAGLAGQPTRITLQSNLAFHHTCFTRLRAANDTSLDPLVDPSGHFPRVCSDIEPALNPQFGGTLRIGDRLGIGLLVLGPSAVSPKNWPEFILDGGGQLRPAPQRYLLTRQSGVLVFPTVGVGYEVAANFRLGVSFGWGIARISTTTATVALANGGQTPDNDIRANVQVRDSFIPRVTGGALWSLSPSVDIAGTYQFTDSLKGVGDVGTATNYYTAAVARGDQRRVGYADTIYSDCGTGRPQDAGKCGDGGNAKVTIPMPMEAKFGIRYHLPRDYGDTPPPKSFRRDPMVHDVFDVEVNLTWANNSAIDDFEVRFPSNGSGGGRLPVAGIAAEIPPNADQPKNYRDVFGVRLGGDLVVLPDQLSLRGGVSWEASGLNETYQHIDFAASQRLGFALGGTYRIRLGKDPQRTDAIEIMAGYGHTFFADQEREDPRASGIFAIAGAPCGDGATATGPGLCSDGTRRYRTRWPVNLGTITNALNVLNVGVAYRF